jgi:hypothetical protein
MGENIRTGTLPSLTIRCSLYTYSMYVNFSFFFSSPLLLGPVLSPLVLRVYPGRERDHDEYPLSREGKFVVFFRN